MRESQTVIFAGPFGCHIFEHSPGKLDWGVPYREIRPEVLAWRLGRLKRNPQSLIDRAILSARFQQSNIEHETNFNNHRAEHPPEPIERRRRRTRPFVITDFH